MPVYGRLPPEIIEDVPLPPCIRDMILPADYVGYPEEVVIHGDREIHQGVEAPLHPRVRRALEDTKRRKVPHRGIGMIEIGPDAEGRLSLFELAITHLSEGFKGFVNAGAAAWAGLLRELHGLETLVVTGTDVGTSPSD